MTQADERSVETPIKDAIRARLTAFSDQFDTPGHKVRAIAIGTSMLFSLLVSWISAFLVAWGFTDPIGFFCFTLPAFLGLILGVTSERLPISEWLVLLIGSVLFLAVGIFSLYGAFPALPFACLILWTGAGALIRRLVPAVRRWRIKSAWLAVGAGGMTTISAALATLLIFCQIG